MPLHVDPETGIVEYADPATPTAELMPSRRSAQEAYDKLILAMDDSSIKDLDDVLDIIRRRLSLKD